jgi:hypothetical protein
VTLPAGASFDDFGRNPDAFRGTAQVDTQMFFETLRTRLIEPVVKTQELLVSRPYLTRMFSTMSADEMTMDPAFGYNSDLADVSNVHKAKQYIECTPDVTQYEAPWRIELPQGGVIRGTGYEWPIEADGALPANLKIVQLSTTGSGEVVADNSALIGDALFKVSKMVGTGEMKPPKPTSGVPIGGEQTVRVPSAPGGSDGPSANAEMSAGGNDCTVSAPGHTRASWALLVLAGAAWLLVQRRRARS